MSSRIIPLLPEGPGLKPMELDPEDFHSPLPRQNLDLVFSDPELGVTVGTWNTTSMQEAFGPYPGDEFIYVLDGNFAMIDGQGIGTPVEAGQAVILRDGAQVSWMQAGYLRKFFIIVDDPNMPTPQNDTAPGGVIVLPADMRLSDDDTISHSDSGAKQRERELFTNAAGTLTVGLWDTEAFTTEPYPFPYHEFVLVLEGEVTIEGAEGARDTFGPGQCFFIPAGTITRWTVPEKLVKYYAAVEPAD